MPVRQVVKGSGRGGKQVSMCVKNQEKQEALVLSEQCKEVIHQIPSDSFDICDFICVHIGTEMSLFIHS